MTEAELELTRSSLFVDADLQAFFWSADLHATELHQKLTVTDWSIKNLPTFDYSQMMNMGWPQRDGAKLQSLITAVIFTTKSFDPKATGFGVKTHDGLLLNGSTDRIARVSKTKIFQILYPCSTCSTKIGRWTNITRRWTLQVASTANRNWREYRTPMSCICILEHKLSVVHYWKTKISRHNATTHCQALSTRSTGTIPLVITGRTVTKLLSLNRTPENDPVINQCTSEIKIYPVYCNNRIALVHVNKTTISRE